MPDKGKGKGEEGLRERSEGGTMKDPGYDDESGHESVWLLLPWYTNDTLQAEERRLVEEHLTACARCREEAARGGELAAGLHASQDPAPSPHPIHLARLMARIDHLEAAALSTPAPHGASPAGAEILEIQETLGNPPAAATLTNAATAAGGAGEANRPIPAAGAATPAPLATPATPLTPPNPLPPPTSAWGAPPKPRVRALLRATPRLVRAALVAQFAAVLALAMVLGFHPAHPGHPGHPGDIPLPESAAPRVLYHTLSAATATAVPAAAHSQIRIMFAEAATERQIREMLLRMRGRLVDGPSPIGAYTLAIPLDPLDPLDPQNGAREPLGTVLAYLRSQSIVRFAEPVAGAPSTIR
jgi:hypothetical protein